MFMVSGYSHMEVDSMHSCIEKKSKSLNIYVPSEWAIVVAIARGNPYLVHQIEQEEIKDLKKLFDDMKITNVTKNTEGETVHWISSSTGSYTPDSIIAWICVKKQNPGILFYKTSYNEEEPFKKIEVSPRKLRTLIQLSRAYNATIPIQKKKHIDLLQLCSDKTIPSKYHEFYKSLVTTEDVPLI
jgi:hypothetical protein